MCRRSWFTGAPKEVAARIQPYVEAGATWVLVGDLMPLLLPMEEAEVAVNRQIEVCHLLKQS
jgi:hypothetical protein